MAGGASAADVRSILSISGPSSASQTPGAGPSPSTSAQGTAASSLTGAGAGGTAPGAGGAPRGKRGVKPEGISRELYALIGPGAPTLTAQLAAKPKFKAKPKLSGGGKAVKWEWRDFRNPARNDNLRLGHWVKASTDPSSEYPFAKYNIQPQTFTYSHDEYSQFLDEPGWTKEETDYLFNIVREYDLRFYVVADRYDFPGGPPRTIEDLKDRYFSMCRRLIRNRPWPGDEAGKNQALASFTFDKERELLRKKYIASLESRTPDQIAEEETLYIEIKRLEQSERKFAREREELLRVLAGVDSGLLNVVAQSAADEEAFASLFGDKVPKKMRKGADLDSPISAVPSSALFTPPTPVKKVQSAKSIAQDLIHCIHRTDGPPTNAPATKAAHQPVFLRSWKLPTPKSAFAPRVAQALGELGVQHTRLVMPTRENCQQLEALLEAAAALVETKKVVDKVEQEIRVLQARKGQRERGEAEDEDKKDADAMDVDGGGGAGGEGGEGDAEEDAEPDPDADADADGETDRAASAAPSARSVSRKRQKRSMSISSVGSAATTATRTSRKRFRA